MHFYIGNLIPFVFILLQQVCCSTQTFFTKLKNSFEYQLEEKFDTNT